MSVVEKLITRKRLHRLKTAVVAGFVAAAAKDVKAANVFEMDMSNDGNSKTLDMSREMKSLLERPSGDWKLGDFTIGKESGYDQTQISKAGTDYGLIQMYGDTKDRYVKYVKNHPEYKKDVYPALKDGNKYVVNKKTWAAACKIPNNYFAQLDFWYHEYLPGGFKMLRNAMQKANLPQDVKQMNFMDLHPAVIVVMMDAMNHHGSFCTMLIPAMEENAKDLNSEKFVRSMIKHRLAAHKRFADKIPYKAFKNRLDDLQSFALTHMKYTPSWQTRYEQGMSVGYLYVPLRKYNDNLFNSGKSFEEIRKTIEHDTSNKTYQAFADRLPEYKGKSSETKSKKTTSKKSSENSIASKSSSSNSVLKKEPEKKKVKNRVAYGNLNQGPARRGQYASESSETSSKEVRNQVKRGDLGGPPSRGYGER